MSTEDFREFINDEKYQDVKNYLLSAFEYIDKKTDFFLKDDSKYIKEYDENEEYQTIIDEIEDIATCSVECIELLKRAYHD